MKMSVEVQTGIQSGEELWSSTEQPCCLLRHVSQLVLLFCDIKELTYLIGVIPACVQVVKVEFILLYTKIKESSQFTVFPN